MKQCAGFVFYQPLQMFCRGQSAVVQGGKWGPYEGKTEEDGYIYM